MTEVRRLEAEVEQRRHALEETAAQLGDKLDVRARGSEAAHRLVDDATTPAGLPKPQVTAVLVGVGVLAFLLIRRRRR